VLPKDGKVDKTTVNQPVQVRIYAFDVLHLNGESVLHLPLWRRQGLLRDYFVATSGFGLATSVRLARYDEALVESALRESVQDGAEGLMIKLTGRRTSGPDSTAMNGSDACVYGYEAGTRSQSWLKVKRDYIGGDVGGSTTIDVVPIGAWYGTGRKAKNGYLSPVLLAVFDDDEGVYYSISRCMSFSDEMYEAMREFYFHGRPYPNGVGINDDNNDKNTATDQEPRDEIELEEPNADGVAKGSEAVCKANETLQRVNCLGARPSWIVTNESPPIWFQPSEVFEVSFADLSLSASHTAANEIVGCYGRGISLRFPRFKRRRPDKNVDQATTPAEVARLYFQQAKIQTPR
jgi:DNA ligase 1